MPSKQTGNIDQPLGFGGLPVPILHEPAHTILSQSSGLWESPPQLIGFACRLGSGPGTGGKAWGWWGWMVVNGCD